MLNITIKSIELYDEAKGEFITTKEYNLQLEHSLVSLSKWESKWCKPFLNKEKKSVEETIDYIRCMTVTPNIGEDAYKYITQENIRSVNSYIDAPMTATHINSQEKSSSRDIVTAEIIYYWMIALNIPLEECQKWHLNRLLTLISVCNIKNKPTKKMSKKEILSRNAAINEARKKSMNTNG